MADKERKEMIDQDVSIYYKSNIYGFDNNIMMDYYPRRVMELAGEGRQTCLELGIGYGVTTGIFSGFFKRHIALEGDGKIIARYRNLHPDAKTEVIETYFEEWEGTGESFDVIVLGFILEHVADPCGILGKYARFLAPGGKMYIAVPNAEALNRRVGVEAGLLKDIFQLSETDLRFGHKRYYTLETIRKEVMADGVGLRITKEEGIFLKPITTAQMISLNLTGDVIGGFLKVGRGYPELCLGLLVEEEKAF